MDSGYQIVKTQENLNQNEKFNWTSFLRQIHICSGVWTIFFLAGMCNGAPTVFIPQLRREKNVIDDELASWLYSTSNIAAIPWLIIVPFFTRYAGRRSVYVLACISILAVFVIMYVSTSPHQILYANVIQGFVNACNVTLMILIVTEHTSPKYRSLLVNVTTASFFWGMWTSNAMGTFLHWKYIAVLGIICSVYTFSVIFYPESPYWLASKGRFRESETSFRWLHGYSEESERELRELIKSQMDYLATKRSYWSFSEFRSKQFYMPLFLTIIISSQTNFSGKVLFSTYAIDVIIKMTNSESAAYSGMLVLDGVTVIGMYVGAYLSNIFKRRTIMFVTSFACWSFLMIISLYLYLVKLSIITENNLLCIVLLVAYSLSISCGSLVIVFAIYGEIVALRFQSVSFMITSLLYIGFSSATLKLAPIIFKAMRMHGSFLFFGITYGACSLILYFYLPETKGKTLLEIQEYFKNKKSTSSGRSELFVD